MITSAPAKLQRYERDVVEHQGGHYGEEQWTTTEMVPCDTGAWVKYSDVAALAVSAPADSLSAPSQLKCLNCKGTGNEPEAGFSPSPCADCMGTGLSAPSVEPTQALEALLDEIRCAVCGWPLDPNGKFCVRGNCSQRPLPSRFYDPARAKAEYSPWLDNDPRTAVPQADVPQPPRPKIICLCGSTRFIETFAIKTWELEREGFIVLGCTLLPLSYCKVASHFGEATGTKAQCDELHLRKIDLADEVLVLNVGGYIGESTRNEVAYAIMHNKPVNYLEALAETKDEPA